MTPEIRRAALRAAAKTALVVSLGCSGSSKGPQPTPTNVAPAPATEPAKTEPACDEYLASLATVKSREQLAEGDPLRDKPEVYAAFSDVALRESPKTKECCTAALVRDGAGAKQRFECCSALGDVPDGATPSACTPWGPPCPPEMS